MREEIITSIDISHTELLDMFLIRFLILFDSALSSLCVIIKVHFALYDYFMSLSSFS